MNTEKKRESDFPKSFFFFDPTTVHFYQCGLQVFTKHCLHKVHIYVNSVGPIYFILFKEILPR